MTCVHRIAYITDGDRRLQQTIKELLDAIAYRVGFFREYDEPNEIFAPRLVRAFPALARDVALLPIWPRSRMRSAHCSPHQDRGLL